jgi:protein O-GlcNAc transferase
MPTISEALAIAVQHHQEARFREAETIYRQILAADPNHPDAWHLLGLVACQFGNYQAGVDCMQRALAFRPDWAQALFNLGNAWKNQGNLDEATASYQKAVQSKPDFSEAHNNLGRAWRAHGNLDEAAACYQRTLRLRPGFAEAHNNLGNVFMDQSKPDEAVACYQRALLLKPDYADAQNNLGNVFKDQGKPDLAAACYERALQLKPDYALAHYNLGVVWQDGGSLDEAVACYRQALKWDPAYAEAHNNLGNALKDQGKLDEAVASFRRAVELKPDVHTAHSNLLYTLVFCPGYNTRAIFDEHQLWSRRFAEPLAHLIQPHPNDFSSRRRLRIGYVSPNFFDHAQSFFTAPLLFAYDHENFEIFCYADVGRPDEITARLRSLTDVWRDIAGLTDEQVARLVRQDRIDILIDLTMHMARNRLLVFARKPAPVQVCWLAYQGTSGLTTVDYRLTDPYIDPPGLFDHDYSEESIRLPDAFWCYDPLAGEPAVSALPALENGSVTFGCLNNFCKVNGSVLKLWAQVLAAVDGSRLMLMAPLGSSRRRTLDLLEHEGVARARVTFVARQPRARYLELHDGISEHRGRVGRRFAASESTACNPS